ncbi:MAG: hypothetical protein MZW92_18250 [Comamonadaceae bacterium]|nr:hypothetical protein [Comamonadaceae bacterium]
MIEPALTFVLGMLLLLGHDVGARADLRRHHPLEDLKDRSPPRRQGRQGDAQQISQSYISWLRPPRRRPRRVASYSPRAVAGGGSPEIRHASAPPAPRRLQPPQRLAVARRQRCAMKAEFACRRGRHRRLLRLSGAAPQQPVADARRRCRRKASSSSPFRYVLGADRTALVQRKLNQFFYGSPFTTGSLPRSREDRPPRRAHAVRGPDATAGIRAVAGGAARGRGATRRHLLGAAAGADPRHRGSSSGRNSCLVVSFGNAGIRQTFLEGGHDCASAG